MTTIVTRAGKGSPLTHTEVDTNFTNLNTAKLETAAIPLGTLQAPSVSFLNDSDTGIFCPQGGNSLAIATGAQYAITCTSTQAVGIKTANPQKALHVAGATRVGADDATDAFLEIGEGATGNRNSYIDIVGDTTYTDYGLRFIRNNTGANATSEIKHRGTGNLNFTTQEAGAIVFNTTNSPSVTIDSSGRLGIGTSSPSSALDVSGAISLGAVALPSAGTARIFSRNTDSNLYIQTGSGNTLNFLDGSQNTMASFGSSTVTLQTGNSPRLSIDSSGRVGIGSTAPSQLLEINSASNPCLLIKDTTNNVIAYTFADDNVANFGSASAHPVVFRINNSEAARIDASSRLLVGTSTAPTVGVPASATFVVQGYTGVPTGDSLISLQRGQAPASISSGSQLGGISFGANDGSPYAQIHAATDGTGGANDYPGRLVFSTTANDASSPTERMRIGNDGRTSTFCSSTTNNLALAHAAGAGTTYKLIEGAYGATGVNTGTESFRVYTNGNVQNTNNSYGAISDIKLKENIVDASSQWDDLKALQVRNYNFKEGQTHTQIGLIAQEVELVSPGLVSESPDRDAEGNDLGTVTKSVNYSVLYMKAVKALQEAMERIEQLEARLTAAGIN